MNPSIDPEVPLPYDDQPMKDHGWKTREADFDGVETEEAESDEEE